jgi:streptomycin 6-kinase
MFETYLSKWNLTPDGSHFATHCAQLLPVRQGDVPCLLKIAREAEEKAGSKLMVWWDGDGAAPVLAHDEDALLLLRAEGPQSLKQMARSGAEGDAEATRILCRTIAQLHEPRNRPLPTLVPLTRWFRDLEPASRTHGGILLQSAAAAQVLLASPQNDVVLHGDIHHDNILDFGDRGWLVIDPKGLRGERGFDYANLFCNPDRELANSPGRLQRLLEIVVAESGIERRRLLQWILAWSGLSNAWILADGENADINFTIAEIAASELQR